MSKMGISVVDSYRGAHLFDAIGLSNAVVDKCFAGTPAPIGGLGFEEIEAHCGAWLGESAAEEPQEGAGLVAVAAAVRNFRLRFCALRKADEAEAHAWQPQSVRALADSDGRNQTGRGAGPGAGFRALQPR